jgi:hypothetical protein
VKSSPCTRKSIFWNLVYPQTSSLQQASANFCPDLCKSETDTEQCFRLLGIPVRRSGLYPTNYRMRMQGVLRLLQTSSLFRTR